jgi:hypothetical protein
LQAEVGLSYTVGGLTEDVSRDGVEADRSWQPYVAKRFVGASTKAILHFISIYQRYDHSLKGAMEGC